MEVRYDTVAALNIGKPLTGTEQMGTAIGKYIGKCIGEMYRKMYRNTTQECHVGGAKRRRHCILGDIPIHFPIHFPCIFPYIFSYIFPLYLTLYLTPLYLTPLSAAPIHGVLGWSGPRGSIRLVKLVSPNAARAHIVAYTPQTDHFSFKNLPKRRFCG